METTAQKKTVTPKKESERFYGYTSKTNMKWIEKESKKFGAKTRFLDALITEARKSKIKVAAPTMAKKALKAKKATKKKTAIKA